MLKPSITNPVQAPIAAEPSHRISQATISRLRPSLSNTQASPSHNGQEARSPATQVELYRLCLLIEVKQTAMLCGALIRAFVKVFGCRPPRTAPQTPAAGVR